MGLPYMYSHYTFTSSGYNIIHSTTCMPTSYIVHMMLTQSEEARSQGGSLGAEEPLFWLRACRTY